MAAIHSLPFELLALVFEQLYHDPNRKRYGDVELGDPSLFPCAVARVCQLWRDVVAERPEYWEHIVFDLASEERSFLDAFGWAKETEFEVLIFDSRYGAYGTRPVEPGSQMSERFTPTSKIPTLMSADHERALVSAITDALLPHLERCLSLQYSTSFSNSLPELPTILHHNPSKRIQILRLDYRINNSKISTRALKYNCDGEAMFPYFDTLSIDVVAFVLMMEQWPQLSRRVFPPRSLEISEYQFSCAHTSEAPPATCKVTNFLCYLSFISDSWSNLCLRGLSMAACGRRDIEAGTTMKRRLCADVFKAVDLSEDFLHHLFQQVNYVGGRFGHFRGRCNFPVNTPALSFPTLCLHGLPLDANLPRLLARWEGHYLTFTSCPCFNDALLDTLAEAGPSIVDCPAPCLHDITINHCDNFSRRALMKFFVKRNKASRKYLLKIHHIAVDGIRVEPTAEEWALYGSEESFPM